MYKKSMAVTVTAKLLFKSYLIALALAVSGFSQSDPLVSKSTGIVVTDSSLAWVFADPSFGFSRINFFTNPIDIHTKEELPLPSPILGGAGRKKSVLLFYGAQQSDSVSVTGLLRLGHDPAVRIDSMHFTRNTSKNTNLNKDVFFNALALAGNSKVVMGAGRAGFAVQNLSAEDTIISALADPALHFLTLTTASDTAQEFLNCSLDYTKPCNIDTLNWINNNIGAVEKILALYVDVVNTDTSWILIGTDKGLRRGLLGSKIFSKITLPLIDKGVSSLVGKFQSNILWAFTNSHFYYSDNHGASFHKPPDQPNLHTQPDNIVSYNTPPKVVFKGDTSIINFDMGDHPGLIHFFRDTLLAYKSTTKNDTSFGEIVLDGSDNTGFDFKRGQGSLLGLGILQESNKNLLIATSNSKGVFYRLTTDGDSGFWKNENRLKLLKHKLKEVVTFPTLFRGTKSNGEPEFVNIGYQLDKDSKVSITVYNYAMEKVKTIVSKSFRKGGLSRSENLLEDRWDGKDSGGRFVSIGTYYILVESENGEKGWGKAIVTRGREP